MGAEFAVVRVINTSQRRHASILSRTQRLRQHTFPMFRYGPSCDECVSDTINSKINDFKTGYARENCYYALADFFRDCKITQRDTFINRVGHHGLQFIQMAGQIDCEHCHIERRFGRESGFAAR